MIFSSYEFIFLFLPVVLLIYFYLGKSHQQKLALSWLVLTSLFFYGFWNPSYLILIIGSMLVNFAGGIVLSSGNLRFPQKKLLLILGILLNLGLLGYFKYVNFVIDNLNIYTALNISNDNIILPLAISFFTFQQITYLVDAYCGETKEYSFLHYGLFVTFFPQLIAGPIVHHKEMLPQFENKAIYNFNYKYFSIGLTIFIIGLTKKVFIADNLAVFADSIFTNIANGNETNFYEAWGAALAYTFQLYFDFSGYSDMAIGLAQMFGIRLPINFNSPYKANNIIEFWRCWHITLSRFLKDYLYVPLGGNRKGSLMRYFNLMITMLLGGLWHGAGWTFIMWGALHGLFLIINQLWRKIIDRLSINFVRDSRIYKFFSWFLTFLCVIVAWVFFRAENFDSSIIILSSMFSFGFFDLPSELLGRIGSKEAWLISHGFSFNSVFLNKLTEWRIGIIYISLAMCIALFLPNTSEIFNIKRKSIISWRPSVIWVSILFLFFSLSMMKLFQVSPFLYYNF